MPAYECACGARYRFDDAHVGRRARCKKCGHVFTLASDAGPIPVADEPDLHFDIDAVAARQAGVRPAVLPFPPVAPGSRVIIERDEEEVAKGPGGYGHDLLWSFLFAAHPRDLVLFVIVWAIVSMLEGFFGFTGFFILGPSGLLLIFVWLIYKGWYAGIRLAIVESAAAGDERLPDLTMTGDWLGDYVIPAIQWAGSWLFVMVPALGYAIYFALSLADAPGAGATGPGLAPVPNILAVMDENAFWWSVGIGLFMWPMVILCIALGGLSTLFRVDLMCVSILRTLPAYVLTVVIVVGVEWGGYLLQGAVYGAVAPAPAGGGVPPLGDRMIAACASNALYVYITIVMVRAIGFYYHHFKHRFAWSWG